MKNIKINVSKLAFEIISFAGDARATYLEILNEAKANRNLKDKTEILRQIQEKNKEANSLLIECHQKQTLALQHEAAGEKINITFLMVHAQDHLMTAILLKEITEHFLTLYGFDI